MCDGPFCPYYHNASDVIEWGKAKEKPRHKRGLTRSSDVTTQPGLVYYCIV
jgi:hypothetical protein